MEPENEVPAVEIAYIVTLVLPAVGVCALGLLHERDQRRSDRLHDVYRAIATRQVRVRPIPSGGPAPRSPRRASADILLFPEDRVRPAASEFGFGDLVELAEPRRRQG